MKRSLTKQIMVIMMSLVVGTIVICFLLNTTFLGTFYTMQKKNLLMESYETIQDASDEGSLYSSEFDQDFDKMCSNQNLSIIIMSADGTPMRSSVNDIRLIQRQFLDVIFGTTVRDRVMVRTDQYILERVRDADMNNEDYLVLWGTLDDGNLILMRTAMDGIRESSKIANQFLLYVGSCAIAGSVLLSILISRRITKPIVQLSEISQKMVDLDFNAKYVRGGWRKKRRDVPGSIQAEKEKMEKGNEIDQLGLHMNQLSDQLERTISELKTANNELMKDIEKKEQIDEMRKEFLSNVSHELKTPLALIQGYAEGLQACINDDEESRDFYCEVIMDEADKMNKMVKKLLTLNQLEFGNDQVYMERFNITELIQGVVNASSLLLEQKGITVEMDLPEEYVWADEFKVEEVITNYLSNAMNHAEGEKKIRIFYEKKDTCLRISVFNTGKPIPEEDIDNIWIKFYKVDKARTRAYGGSGIGLSIVKAIMDSFHQECGVINRKDGVEFWLELGL
ncbi:MAG TPA: two-component sensor histidine kinase [Candidatus Eubacterium avistercoris]|uniref:histidine kinase n=1 Tax=Candidatus Eubacterium avistercoris TaxID=2838567 RepID=A0A9D2D4A6_9FIRM|nr:two-component sensor histidine kinase [Candidatus Eubacterium avistercoris]